MSGIHPTAATEVFRALAGDVTAIDVNPNGRQVSDETVDAFQGVIEWLRHLDNHLGGPRVTYDAVLNCALELIKNCSHTEQVGRRLYGVVAELFRLCGWVAYDSDNHDQACSYWLLALDGARSAGDTAMGAHSIASISALALKADDRRGAVALAEAARSHYTGSAPRVLIRLHLQAAKSFAAIGRTTECHREMESAEDLVSRLDEPAPAWASWLDAGVVASDVGWCHSRLGDDQKAIDNLERGLALHRGFPRDEALFRTHLATAALTARRPDLDLAVVAANAASELLEQTVTSPRCVGELREFATLSVPYRRHPGVRDSIERIRALAVA